jgi:hypothetical protein
MDQNQMNTTQLPQSLIKDVNFFFLIMLHMNYIATLDLFCAYKNTLQAAFNIRPNALLQLQLQPLLSLERFRNPLDATGWCAQMDGQTDSKRCSNSKATSLEFASPRAGSTTFLASSLQVRW